MYYPLDLPVLSPRHSLVKRDNSARGPVKADGYFKWSSGSQAEKEYAAYLLGTLLGLRMIPGWIHEDDDGKGWVSVWQQDLEFPMWDGFTLLRWAEGNTARLRELARVWVLDTLIDNSDRHGGNIAVNSDDELVLLDHDVTFDDLSGPIGKASRGQHPKYHTIAGSVRFNEEEHGPLVAQEWKRARSILPLPTLRAILPDDWAENVDTLLDLMNKGELT